MATQDPRVDAYIAKAAPFAQPVLEQLRARVHAACPGIEETIKWNMPFFMHAGRPLAHMAAFKAHCVFGLWKGRSAGVDLGHEGEAMGQLGRITSLADLPGPRAFKTVLREAVARSDALAAAAPAPRARRAAGGT